MAKEDIDKSLDGNLSIGKSADRLHQKRAALYENTINEQFQPKNNIYNHSNFDVYIKDVFTGKTIPYYSINDAVRMARAGDNPGDDDSSTMYSHRENPNTLGQMRVNSTEHFNAKSCVESLGFYTTEYIKQQVMTLGDKNSDLGMTEDYGAMDNLTFRNYIKTGLTVDPVTQEPLETVDEDAGYKRVAPNLGIGLGESIVLNPVFQFNKRDDPRTNPMYTKIGRIYSTRVMNNWPIVLFQPGRLKYNTGFMKLLGLGGGAGASDAYIRSGGEGIVGAITAFFTTITDIIGVVGTIGGAIFGGSKIVEFRQAIKLYNQYYSMFLISLAEIMGLYHEDVSGEYRYSGEIKYLDIWNVLPTLHMNGGITKYIKSQFIPFRCQKGMVGSETFSNNTEDNPLMEEMNSTATQNDDTVSQGSFLTAGKDFLMTVASTFSDKAAVLSGNGRITLPNVYASSSFSRSFNVGFEFHYPYGDALGKFENTQLQLITLLTLGLPRQTGKLTYTSPFAVRVFVKNHIMINYGMIESISVTRGGDANDWGPDGFPKTLKVDVSIKDMEPNISLPLAARGPLRMALETMFPASGFSEYLATIGGLEIDQIMLNAHSGAMKRAVNIFRSAWSQKLNPDHFLASVANTRLLGNIFSWINTSQVEKYVRLGDINRMYTESNMETMASSTWRPMPGGPGGMVAMTDFGTSENSSGTKLSKEAQGADAAGLELISKEMSQNRWYGDK